MDPIIAMATMSCGGGLRSINVGRCTIGHIGSKCLVLSDYPLAGRMAYSKKRSMQVCMSESFHPTAALDSDLEGQLIHSVWTLAHLHQLASTEQKIGWYVALGVWLVADHRWRSGRDDRRLKGNFDKIWASELACWSCRSP